MVHKYVSYHNKIKVKKYYSKYYKFINKFNKLSKKFFALAVIILTVLAIIGHFNIYSIVSDKILVFANKFAINKIELKGNKRLTEEFIIKCSGLKYGMNLFTKFPTEVKFNIMQNCHSSVEEAQVVSVIPDITIIEIKERQPVAIWKNHNKDTIIDKEGHIIESNVTNDDKAKYITIFGDGANKYFYSLITLMEKEPYYSKIISMHFVNKRRWDIFLDSGTIIKLPEENTAESIKVLNSIYVKTIAKNADIIDMRLAPKKIFFTNIKPIFHAKSY